MPTRVARWSLLAAALVFGIALMHTLGHPAVGGHHAAMSGPATEVAAAQQGSGAHPDSTVDELFAASDPYGGMVGAMVASMHLPAPGPHGMDPSLMCLAILTALSTVAAALALLHHRSTPVRPLAATATAGRAPRSPPTPRVGRRLATLSILRI